MKVEGNEIMTQEEKELLLVDLCARLPYGVKANIPLVDGDERIYTVSFDDMKDFVKGYINIKPFLRPMYSMTIEEHDYYNNSLITNAITICEENLSNYLEFMHSHHFDYLGLIEKGLALEAPEDMYNTKIK